MTAKQEHFDVAIAGAGPAGTSAAIHLAQRGARVLLVEDKKFPRAKLCGEFISPECVPHFRQLGTNVTTQGAVAINRTVFYSQRGRSIAVPSDWFRRDTHAIGLSRSEMDQRLLQRAKDAGVTVIEEAHASNLVFENGNVCGLMVKTVNGPNPHRALVTIDATGRQRALVRHLESPSKQRRHKLVAFKAHFANARPAADECEIYVYRGGYGGLNNVEGGVANLCFIVRADEVRKHNSDPDVVMRRVVMKNARAAETLADAHAQTPWISVALEGFGRHNPSPAPGLLTIGDAASFIDPFTGSGILMALESGQLAASVIARHLSAQSLHNLARDYAAEYNKTFNQRFKISGLLRRAAFVPALAETVIYLCGLNSTFRRSLAQATRESNSVPSAVNKKSA